MWLKCKPCRPLDGNLHIWMSLHSERRLKMVLPEFRLHLGNSRLNILHLNDIFFCLPSAADAQMFLRHSPHRLARTHQNAYLQGQQGVAVAVCAKDVLFYPGFRPQRSSRTWELGWSDDVARKGLLQGGGVANRPRYTHAASSAVVPAPGHPAWTPAIALVAAPGRRFHHGLRRHIRRVAGVGHRGERLKLIMDKNFALGGLRFLSFYPIFLFASPQLSLICCCSEWIDKKI